MKLEENKPSAEIPLPSNGEATVPPLRGTSAKGIFADVVNTVAILGDLFMVVLGLMLGFWVRFHSGLIPVTETWWTSGDSSAPGLYQYTGLFGIGTILLFITFLYLNLYQIRNLLRFRRVGLIISKGLVFWLFAYLSLSLVLKFNPPISRIYVASSFILMLAALMVWRVFFHRLLRSEAFARNLRQNVVFIGWNPDALRLAEGIYSDPLQPYTLVGYVTSSSGSTLHEPSGDVPHLGDLAELSELFKKQNIDIAVLVDLETPQAQIISLTNLCERELVRFSVVPSYFQILISSLKLDTISGIPIMGVGELPLNRLVNRIMKRSVDICGALVGMTLSCPIMATLGVLIWLESPGNIFFSQERVGRNGRRFKMYKLRSMKLGSDKFDHLSQSTGRADPRVLRVGKFIRRWNLDEVPQFFNVLIGDMSLVGPRPERTFHSEKLSLEIPHYNARLASKPGITGWAQVNGLRGDTDLAERVRYDLYYMENWSLWLDFQIMIQTFLKRDNAY